MYICYLCLESVNALVEDTIAPSFTLILHVVLCVHVFFSYFVCLPRLLQVLCALVLDQVCLAYDGDGCGCFIATSDQRASIILPNCT